MTRTTTAQRKLGRPRTFDDEAVFNATARAVRAHGYARLTLAVVARELGVTAPALVERFGSKHQLLQSYLRWSGERVRERFDQIRAGFDSPLAALVARFTLPRDERIDEVGNASEYVNITLFYLSASSDPLLKDAAEERSKIYHEEIVALLDDAVAAGELVPCDTERLARTMLATLSGVALQWAGGKGPELEDRIVQGIEDLIAHYRVPWQLGRQ